MVGQMSTTKHGHRRDDRHADPEQRKRKAVRSLAAWQAIALFAALFALVCLLSGCLTPAKLQTWSTEADAIAQASTDLKCVESAIDLQAAIVRALEAQRNATRYLDGAAAPDVSLARAEMMTACKRKELGR